MGLKNFVMNKGMELLSDPRVLKLMQDERVMKVAMRAMDLRGRVHEGLTGQNNPLTRVTDVVKSFTNR